jgi:CheY-like chemotaxis protein
MPDGGALTIETSNVELDASYTQHLIDVQPGPYVMLSVSDTGIGMDEQTCSRIFEPFFSTKEQGKGTGFGLSTSYGIVKQSGGHIAVYSEPGQGATFKVYLPRVDAQPDSLLRESQSAAVAQGSETVLVVEDEDEVRHLARRVLENAGYQVLDAALPDDALQLAAQHDGGIDVLLTDVVMPHMGGRELAERLLAERPATRVMFMSGYTDTAVIKQGVLEPGTVFLQKPFVPSQLTRMVRELIDHASAAGEARLAAGD